MTTKTKASRRRKENFISMLRSRRVYPFLLALLSALLGFLLEPFLFARSTQVALQKAELVEQSLAQNGQAGELDAQGGLISASSQQEESLGAERNNDAHRMGTDGTARTDWGEEVEAGHEGSSHEGDSLPKPNITNTGGDSSEGNSSHSSADVEPGNDAPVDEEQQALAEKEKEELETHPQGIAKPYDEIAFQGDFSSYSLRNPKGVKLQLASAIRGRLKDLEPETVIAFVQEPLNRLQLAQWELFNMIGGEFVSEESVDESDTEPAEGESKDKKVSDVNAARAAKAAREAQELEKMKDMEARGLDADFRNNLGPLINDLPWIVGFVYDGEVKDVNNALGMISYFREEDKNMDTVYLSEERGDKLRDQYIKRRVAAAVAIGFSNQSWFGVDFIDGLEKERKEWMGQSYGELKKDKKDEEYKQTKRGQKKEEKRVERMEIYQNAYERYLFFANSVDDRLLNPDFYNMPNWLMRFPCGWNMDKYGTLQCMEWMRDNNCMPAYQYGNIIAQVPYLTYNLFGYNVDAPEYYQGVMSLYPDNHQKLIRDVGAVCMGQAHYAAGSASANGVPAFVVSEPNHNSYAIYYDGAWHPCNSGSPRRHPKWDFWGDSSWNTLEMYTRMYHDAKKSRDAQLITTLGNLLSQHRNAQAGLQVYEIALKMQPLNRPAWDLYLSTILGPLAKSPQRWEALNTFICQYMCPENPSACSTYLMEKIYPRMMKILKAPRQKLDAFEQYFLYLDKQEPNPWTLDALLEAQQKELGRSTQLRHEHYCIVAKAVCKHPEFANALTWALNKAYAQGDPIGKKVIDVVREYRKESPNQLLIDSAIVRAAETLEDIELFQEFSADYLNGLGGMPELPSVKGNLISAGGMVHLSSYSEDEEVCAYHAAALTEQGGKIESRVWMKESVTVELEKVANIGDIIIVPSCGSVSPYYMWNISISTDGKKWQELAKLPDNLNAPFLHLKINKQHPSAKFIKIDSGMSMTQGIQFKAVLIYDNKNKI